MNRKWLLVLLLTIVMLLGMASTASAETYIPIFHTALITDVYSGEYPIWTTYDYTSDFDVTFWIEIEGQRYEETLVSGYDYPFDYWYENERIGQYTYWNGELIISLNSNLSDVMIGSNFGLDIVPKDHVPHIEWVPNFGSADGYYELTKEFYTDDNGFHITATPVQSLKTAGYLLYIPSRPLTYYYARWTASYEYTGDSTAEYSEQANEYREVELPYLGNSDVDALLWKSGDEYYLQGEVVQLEADTVFTAVPVVRIRVGEMVGNTSWKPDFIVTFNKTNGGFYKITNSSGTGQCENWTAFSGTYITSPPLNYGETLHVMGTMGEKVNVAFNGQNPMIACSGSDDQNITLSIATVELAYEYGESYKVRFDSNGNGTVDSTQTIHYNGTCPITMPAEDNCLGWKNDSDNKYNPPGAVVNITKDTLFTAKIDVPTVEQTVQMLYAAETNVPQTSGGIKLSAAYEGAKLNSTFTAADGSSLTFVNGECTVPATLGADKTVYLNNDVVYSFEPVELTGYTSSLNKTSETPSNGSASTANLAVTYAYLDPPEIAAKIGTLSPVEGESVTLETTNSGGAADTYYWYTADDYAALTGDTGSKTPDASTALASGTSSSYTFTAAYSDGNADTYYCIAANVNGTGETDFSVDVLKKATITFLAGDDAASGDMEAKTATEGETYTIPENGFTAPDGYAFSHWTDGQYTYAPGATLTIGAEDITLTAVWAELHTVTVKLDDLPTEVATITLSGCFWDEDTGVVFSEPFEQDEAGNYVAKVKSGSYVNLYELTESTPKLKYGDGYTYFSLPAAHWYNQTNNEYCGNTFTVNGDVTVTPLIPSEPSVIATPSITDDQGDVYIWQNQETVFTLGKPHYWHLGKQNDFTSATVAQFKIAGTTHTDQSVTYTPDGSTNGEISTYVKANVNASFFPYYRDFTLESDTEYMYVIEPGNLSVSLNNDNGLTADMKFTATVTLTPPTEDLLVNGTYGGATFTDNVATFEVMPGTPVEITGLPGKVAYTVEITPPGFGYITTSSVATGEIAEGTTATASFTYSYDQPAIDFVDTAYSGVVSEALSMTVTTAGNLPEGCSIAWYKGEDLISGASETTYTITSLETGHAGAYKAAILMNEEVVAETESVNLTVLEPEVALDAGSYNGREESSLTMTATIVNMPENGSVSWTKDGEALAGGTVSGPVAVDETTVQYTLTLDVLALTDAGEYTVSVLDDYSDTANLSVTPLEGSIVITVNGSEYADSGSISGLTAGEDVVITVATTGGAAGYDVSYTLDDGESIAVTDGTMTLNLKSGTRTLTLTAAPATAAFALRPDDSGNYTATFTLSVSAATDPDAPAYEPDDPVEPVTGGGNEILDLDPATTDTFDNHSINITGEAKTEEPTVYTTYYVELVWGDMAFKWMAPSDSTKIWQTDDHTYEYTEGSTQTGYWDMVTDSDIKGSLLEGRGSATGDQATVLVFNHSNAPVDATIAIVDKDVAEIKSTLEKDTDGAASPASESEQSITYSLPAAVENDLDTFDETTSSVYDQTTTAKVQVKLSDPSNVADIASTTVVATLTVTLEEP